MLAEQTLEYVRELIAKNQPVGGEEKLLDPQVIEQIVVEAVDDICDDGDCQNDDYNEGKFNE